MLELKLKPPELKKLMRIMNDCLYAQSNEDVLRIIDRLNEIIPFNAAILCRKAGKKGAVLLDESVNHSYPEGWLKNYYKNKLFLLDPIAIASSNINAPFTWKDAYSRVEMTNRLRAFINTAEDFGLKEGLTYSSNIRQGNKADTLMSLETSGHKVDDEYLAIVEYILPHIHEVIIRIDEKARRTQEELPELTARERETLKWAYEGKTAWEIGVILSISERTVKFHLKNIYEKLDVKNRSQAVAKAARYGIV